MRCFKKLLFSSILIVLLKVNSSNLAPVSNDGPYEKPKNCTLNNGQGQRLLYYLYTTKTRNNPEKITIFSKISSSQFNPNRKTIILVHGWQNDINSDMIQVVKEAYLNLGDYNVIGVDWGFKSHSLYPKSAACTVVIAQWIGDFISYLIDPGNKINAQLDKINLVGHSLGAQIVGMVGEYFRLVQNCSSIIVIIGLDPAGPAFELQNRFNRLDLYDATYVEVIHTSIEYFGIYHLAGLFGLRPLGMPESIGDVDIYPQYGGNQPGCTNGFERFFGACAHGKSYQYFAHSLTATNETASIAIECLGGYRDIKNNNCMFGPRQFYFMGDPEDRMNLSKTRQNTSMGVYIFNKDKEEISTLASFQFNLLVFLFVALLLAAIGLIGYCFLLSLDSAPVKPDISVSKTLNHQQTKITQKMNLKIYRLK